MINVRSLEKQSFLPSFYASAASQSGNSVPEVYILSRQNNGQMTRYDNRKIYPHDVYSQIQNTAIINFDYYINDAIQRYKLVNHADSYDLTLAKPFLSALRTFCYSVVPRITFYDDAVKVRLIFNQQEFIIDYDYEEPDSVFVSTFEDDNLIIKDGNIAEIYALLRSF
jgi:hypothetical protein